MPFQPPPPPAPRPNASSRTAPAPASPSRHPAAPPGLAYTGETVAPRRQPPANGAKGKPSPAGQLFPVGPASFSWQSLVEQLRAWIERSPPLSVSVALHILVLLALAIWIVREPAHEEPVIEISFSTFSEVIHEEKGVEIPPTPEPVEEPQPEEAVTEKPPVEDPIAAPPKAVEEVVESPGPSTSQVAAAPVIGTLLEGRQEGRREALVKAYGGSDATEAAVAKALTWLAKQQDRKTGLWSLQGPYENGSSKENQVAATAMALLAFQGAGNTPRVGKHRAVLTRAWKGLLAAQTDDGQFRAGPMPARQELYSHGQVTVALCELYGMTQEKKYFEPAQRAVAFAIKAQGPAGGWRYEPGKDGDMSVTGWYMMALKSAEMAYVPVPETTFEGLEKFLDRVAVEDGARYGYRSENPDNPAAPVTDAVSAEGLLCRQYLGWTRDDSRLTTGAEMLLAGSPIDFDNQPNAYAWYYITQVVHHLGGSAWERWNERMKDAVPAAQVKNGPEAGSWDPSGDRWGGFGGRLYMTCFCTYMLEVYYRHLPLYDGVQTEE